MTDYDRVDATRRGLLLGSLAGGGLFAARSAWGAGLTEQEAERPTPVVETTHGRIRGVTRGAASLFRGIPYGASTAGEARFLPPRPPLSWTGVRQADRFGDRCVQNPFPAALTGGDEDIASSEDCLSLNIWTPGLGPDARRPVMVWFHGGGFTIGHGAQARYEGTNLAIAEDVVVVTVNHRLGAFGFLHLDGIDPLYAGSGNAGLLDCIAALRWVRDNIAEFGGDPGNVTVFGQSGGAAKISTLMAMPAAAGLFHKAIVQSGSWLRAMDREAATANARSVLAALEIDPGRLDALQAIPAERLLSAGNSAVGPGLTAWGPVVDGTALPRHPWSPDAPALFADIPMIIGTTKDETTLFTLLAGGAEAAEFALDEADVAPRLAALLGLPADRAATLAGFYRNDHPQATPSDLFFRAASQAGFRVPAVRQAERKAAQHGGPAYMYLFVWQSPTMGGRLRSAHSSEVPFVFANPDSYPLNGAGADRAAMAALMSRTWAAFARTGDPNHAGLPRWRPYDTDERATMILDTAPRAASDPDGEARVLLHAHLPE